MFYLNVCRIIAVCRAKIARKAHLKAKAAKKDIKKQDKLDNAIQLSLIRDEPGLKNAPIDFIQ